MSQSPSSVPNSKPSSPPAPRAERRPESQTTPMELPLEHSDLPGISGHIGEAPEDFQVVEIPLYEPSGEGDHWYVQVTKREATTAELVETIAKLAGVKARDVGYAGMKDKHAVTTQWLSVPAVGEVKEPSSWELPANVQLLKVSRHGNKLRMGHLTGNRFRIRVVTSDEQALPKAGVLAKRIEEEGLGNYFGSQRFGNGGRNLESALFGLDRGRLNRRGGNRAKFLASVIQSEHFNRYTAARIGRGAKQLLEGEVVRLEGSRTLFVVEDPAKEQPRLAASEVHLTGPMTGPKMKEPTGALLALEQRAADELGLDARALEKLAPVAPGTRRDLLVFPAELSVEPAAEGGLWFSFALPAGAYASLVIRAFTRSGPWLPRPERESVSAPAQAASSSSEG